MDATLKEAYDGLEAFEKSAIGKQVKQWEKIIKDAKDPIKEEIKGVVKTNGLLITRMWHRPNNMVVSFKDKTSVKGFINWESQAWDWELKTRSMPAQIQKVVTLSARF